jgi:hypothetical protein
VTDRRRGVGVGDDRPPLVGKQPFAVSGPGPLKPDQRLVKPAGDEAPLQRVRSVILGDDLRTCIEEA